MGGWGFGAKVVWVWGIGEFGVQAFWGHGQPQRQKPADVHWLEQLTFKSQGMPTPNPQNPHAHAHLVREQQQRAKTFKFKTCRSQTLQTLVRELAASTQP